MSALPKDLNQIAKQAGVRKSARRTDLAEAFARGEFTDASVNVYLERQKTTKPHWFKERVTDPTPEEFKKSNNPWSPEGWNVSKQGACVKALGVEKATGIAKAAGSFVGATRPAKKVA